MTGKRYPEQVHTLQPGGAPHPYPPPNPRWMDKDCKHYRAPTSADVQTVLDEYRLRNNLPAQLFLPAVALMLAGAALFVHFRRHAPVQPHLSRVVIAPLLDACAQAGGRIEMTYTDDEFMDITSVRCLATRFGGGL